MAVPYHNSLSAIIERFKMKINSAAVLGETAYVSVNAHELRTLIKAYDDTTDYRGALHNEILRRGVNNVLKDLNAVFKQITAEGNYGGWPARERIHQAMDHAVGIVETARDKYLVKLTDILAERVKMQEAAEQAREAERLAAQKAIEAGRIDSAIARLNKRARLTFEEAQLLQKVIRNLQEPQQTSQTATPVTKAGC